MDASLQLTSDPEIIGPVSDFCYNWGFNAGLTEKEAIEFTLASELDLDLDEGLSGGASDGNITNQYTATLDGLGAVGEGAHAYHEKIFLEKTLKRCALLSLLILASEISSWPLPGQTRIHTGASKYY